MRTIGQVALLVFTLTVYGYLGAEVYFLLHPPVTEKIRDCTEIVALQQRISTAEAETKATNGYCRYFGLYSNQLYQEVENLKEAWNKDMAGVKKALKTMEKQRAPRQCSSGVCW